MPRFGGILKIFGYFKKHNLAFTRMLNLLCPIFYALGKFPLLQMAKFWKINQPSGHTDTGSPTHVDNFHPTIVILDKGFICFIVFLTFLKSFQQQLNLTLALQCDQELTKFCHLGQRLIIPGKLFLFYLVLVNMLNLLSPNFIFLSKFYLL